MEIPTDVAIATLSVAGAAIAHTARLAYLTIKDRQDDARGVSRHSLSPEQMRELSEIVASAVGRVVVEQLAQHSDREERQMERLLAIETHEADRAARVESMLERLATVTEYGAQRSAEQYRSIMDRLDALTRQMERRAA